MDGAVKDWSADVFEKNSFNVTQQVDENNGKKFYILSQPNEFSNKDSVNSESVAKDSSNLKVRRQPKSRYLKDCPSLVVSSSKEMFQNLAILPGDKYYCQICDRYYKTNTTMMTHVRARHLKCSSACRVPGCQFVAMTKHEKKAHEKMHEREMKDVGSKEKKRGDRILPVPCEEELKNEILKNNKNIPGMVKSMDKSIKGKVKYTCIECNQVFTNTYHAARHKEVHQQKPKRCYYCGDIRRGDMDLQVHYVRKHKNEGIHTFTCSGCQIGFSSHKMFLEHTKSPNKQEGCMAGNMSQEFFYGKLPDRIVLDPTLNQRVSFFEKRHLKREASEPISELSIKQPKIVQETFSPPKSPILKNNMVDINDNSSSFMDLGYQDPIDPYLWQNDISQLNSFNQLDFPHLECLEENIDDIFAGSDEEYLDKLADIRRLSPEMQKKFDSYMSSSDPELVKEVTEEILQLPVVTNASFIECDINNSSEDCSLKNGNCSKQSNDSFMYNQIESVGGLDFDSIGDAQLGAIFNNI